MKRAMLFGKLPAHGDFVARGLDPATRDGLDAWLSASMQDARDAHGDAFDALYGRAPPWRYVLADGDAWGAGALVASVDAAGRLFPAMAGYVGLDERQVAAGAAAAEALLFRALTEQLDADAAHAALAAADLARDEAETPIKGWWTPGSGGEQAFPPARADGPHPPALARLMLTASPA